MDPELAGIAITLAFSAFFSASEIAFLSSNRLHIAVQERKGSASAKLVAGFVARPGNFIASTLIGNTVALVGYGVFMAAQLEPVFEASFRDMFPGLADGNGLGILVLLTQTLVSTMLVLATAEFLPKSLSLINPEKFLLFVAFPLKAIYTLLHPFSWLMVNLSKTIMRKGFGIHYGEEEAVFGLTDLNTYINSTVPESEKHPEINKEIFSNALEFKKVRVRDCMIPRKELIAVELDDDIADLKNTFVESGHSKVLVYKESIDNIVGYVHVLELFKKPKTVQQVLVAIIIVPETMLAKELMIRFISERKSLALVVDEFGGTSGIATIEDIMEEIFGEIEDEYDDEDLEIRQLDDHSYILSARHEIDHLNNHHHFGIPEGDYDTLGGFILSIHNDLPAKGETVSNGRFSFEIRSMAGARIDSVKMILNEEGKENN